MIKNLKIDKIFIFLRSKKSRQVLSLYSSMVFGVLLGIGISLVNTRALGKDLYGDFKFIQSVFAFVITFSTLGLYNTCGRLIAQDKNKHIKKELIGTVFAASILLSLFITLVIFVFSFFQDEIFSNSLGELFRLFSILSLVFPVQLFLENILQGDNRIYDLSIFRMLPKLLYVIIALVVMYSIGLSLKLALFLHFFTIGILEIWILFRLKFKFKTFKKTFALVWEENKRFGFQVFLGSIAGVATAHLGALSIGYFMDNAIVGFYALAITATTPLSLVPSTIGTTFFKDFANMNKIPHKVILYTIVISGLTLAGFLLIIKYLVVFLYTEEYIEVVPFAYILAVGAVIHGLGDFINRFLGAQGRGKQMRNSNFILGAVNVTGYLGLVYFFDANGAAVTRVVAALTYLFLMAYFYRKGLKNNS